MRATSGGGTGNGPGALGDCSPRAPGPFLISVGRIKCSQRKSKCRSSPKPWGHHYYCHSEQIRIAFVCLYQRSRDFMAYRPAKNRSGNNRLNRLGIRKNGCKQFGREVLELVAVNHEPSPTKRQSRSRLGLRFLRHEAPKRSIKQCFPNGTLRLCAQIIREPESAHKWPQLQACDQLVTNVYRQRKTQLLRE